MFGLLLSEMKFLRRATLNGESFFLFLPAALPFDPKTFLELGNHPLFLGGVALPLPSFHLTCAAFIDSYFEGGEILRRDANKFGSMLWKLTEARQLKP